MRIETLCHQTVLQVRIRTHPTAGLPSCGECQQFKTYWYDWEKRVRPEAALACYAKGKSCAFHSKARLCYSRF
jgi:hypothetical protein